MKDGEKPKERLLVELRELRQRVEELEAADAELQKTQTFYQQLVEGSGDAIIALDKKGTVVTWNIGAERMLGWKAEEILGYPHARHQTDETKEEIGKYLRQILAGESLDNIEMPLLTKNGTWFDALVTGSPIRDLSGEIVAAHVIIKDITERKRAEEVTRERESALKSIFRVAPIGIGVVADRVIKQANDRLCEMLGYSREELLDKSARMLYPTRGDYEFVGKEKYEQIKREGQGTVETRWLRKGGEVINILLSSTPFDPDDF